MKIEVKPLKEINLEDSFFDSFRESYINFNDWFNRKRDKEAFIVRSTIDRLDAFLLLKIEEEDEDYGDISPDFPKKKRLKICSFKVAAVSRGLGIGRGFISVILAIAKTMAINEIYITIFDDDEYRRELIRFLRLYGFKFHGYKISRSGCEKVYVRKM